VPEDWALTLYTDLKTGQGSPIRYPNQNEDYNVLRAKQLATLKASQNRL